MKCIKYNKYGGPDVMSLQEFDLDEPAPGQIAVRVKAASINPVDWKTRNGEYKLATGRTFPRVMGSDFSGIVEKVGPGVSRFKVNDQVFGLARFKECGAFAEAIITDEAIVTIKPPELSFEDAACLPTVAVTAWNALAEKGNIKSGSKVFIAGCLGSVGRAAVQLAQLKRATVYGTCRKEDVERAHKLGVETAVDYNNVDYSTLNGIFDIVLDTSLKLSLSTRFQLLKSDGIVADLNPSPTMFLRAMFNKKLKIVICSANPSNLKEIADAAAAQKLKIPIGKTVPLKDAIKLISDIEKGENIGGKGIISV